MLRQEVRKLTKEIKENLVLRYGHERVLNILTKNMRRLEDENRRLTAQNNKLMDRMMARDFESYATYKEDESDVFTPSSDSFNEPILNENNIGEVVEDETTGRN